MCKFSSSFTHLKINEKGKKFVLGEEITRYLLICKCIKINYAVYSSISLETSLASRDTMQKKQVKLLLQKNDCCKM